MGARGWRMLRGGLATILLRATGCQSPLKSRVLFRMPGESTGTRGLIMKFSVVTGIFGDRGPAPGAVTVARCERARSRPDGEGRAIPRLAQARGRGGPRRFRLL